MTDSSKIQFPEVTVMYGDTTLRENYDYTVDGDITVSAAGSYSVTVSGINDYEGTVSVPYTVSHATGTWTVTVPATCTAQGMETQVCPVCGEMTGTRSIEASGHHFDGGMIRKAPSCMDPGVKIHTCTDCGTTKTESVMDPEAHQWEDWSVVSEATVFEPEKQQQSCLLCGTSRTRTGGSKLEAFISVNASSLKLSKNQSTTAFQVSDMANGDYVKAVTSSNTKVLKVVSFDKNGTIRLKAQKKTGNAKLTVMLASGLEKKISVKVQAGTVTTTKIRITPKRLELSKGSTVTLTPVIIPITSQQKTTYTSSNQKVATVNSKGVIKGKRAGKTTITVKSGNKKATVIVTVTYKE